MQPHIWNRALLCIYCLVTAREALRRNPESRGVGPCYGRTVNG